MGTWPGLCSLRYENPATQYNSVAPANQRNKCTNCRYHSRSSRKETTGKFADDKQIASDLQRVLSEEPAGEDGALRTANTNHCCWLSAVLGRLLRQLVSHRQPDRLKIHPRVRTHSPTKILPCDHSSFSFPTQASCHVSHAIVHDSNEVKDSSIGAIHSQITPCAAMTCCECADKRCALTSFSCSSCRRASSSS